MSWPVADLHKMIPIEMWELILNKLNRADIMLCRILSQDWNDVVLSYLRSSERGRALSPLVHLASDKKFKKFTSLMRKAGFRRVPFFKFKLNVFCCSVGVIQNFGIVSGHLVSECILQIHPPGFYDRDHKFHPSTVQELTPVVEYSASAKMAIFLRHSSNIVKLTLCEGSVYTYQLHPIFIVLPNCLLKLRTLVIEYYPGCVDAKTTNWEFSSILPPLKGHDFVSAVVSRSRNLETLRLEPYHASEAERKIARILNYSKTMPSVSIYIGGDGCFMEYKYFEIFSNFEESSRIRMLTMSIDDFGLRGRCLLQVVSQVLSKMSETLVSLSLSFTRYCPSCKEGNFKLPQIKMLRELSLVFGYIKPFRIGDCKLPRGGPLFPGQFPNLRRIKLANPMGQKDIGKGYQCHTVHTLEVCSWTDFDRQRWDVIFPNLKTIIFHSPAPRTRANYVSIIPAIVRYLTKIEELYVWMIGCSWETLTGDPEEPTHHSLLALLPSTVQNLNGEKSSFGNLKNLKSLNVNIKSYDARTLKAFIYISKIYNFKVPNFTINCLRQDRDTVHEHFLEYLSFLGSLYPGFRYTLRVTDREYSRRQTEGEHAGDIHWAFLRGREVDAETFTNLT